MLSQGYHDIDSSDPECGVLCQNTVSPTRGLFIGFASGEPPDGRRVSGPTARAGDGGVLLLALPLLSVAAPDAHWRLRSSSLGRLLRHA